MSAVKKITDAGQVKRLYSYWRIRILYNMYFGYAIFYFTRKSLTFVAPVMIHHHILTLASFGLINTVFYLLYGSSKFFSGIISDRVNARYFMSVGLIITGVANICFGLSSNLLWFFIFWMVNAIFQGWGWPPCAKLLTHWYPRTERGRWWSLWNTCHNVGGALIPLLIGLILMKFNHWYLGMMIPGFIGVAMGLLLMVGLRDVPSSLGLPEPASLHSDSVTESIGSDADSLKVIISRYVLRNPYLWLLAMSYVVIYIIRTAINDWGSLYLSQNVYLAGSYNHRVMLSNDSMSFLEIGGFLGSLAAGWLSDIAFRGSRSQTNVLFTIGTIASVVFFWYLRSPSFYLQAAGIFLIGFCVFGPQMLIGVAAAEMSHKRAAGAATGFVGLFGYIGAALTGYPMSQLLGARHYVHYNWSAFFEVLVICGVIACVLLSIVWYFTLQKKASAASSEMLKDSILEENLV